MNQIGEQQPTNCITLKTEYMKPFIQTTFILFFIGTIIMLVNALITIEKYKDRLEQKESEYQELNTLFLWYEHEYLKDIYDIPKDSIALRMPPEYQN